MPDVPHVFLSHASQDKPLVRKLAEDLMREGVSVWLDEAEIKVGDSIPQRINQALLYADYVIAFLSRHSVQSRWVKQELEAAFAKNAEGARSLIIPILLEGLDPEDIPPSIRDVKWIDFSKDYKVGLAQLLRTLTGARQQGTALKPKLSAFFDPADFAKEIAMEVMHELKADPKGVRLPDWDPDPHLVFVIISFSSDMEPIFEGIKAAGMKHKLRIERVKDVPGDYRINDKIVQMIHQARIVVADLSHERPNVYFELGYSRGLGKTVVTIAREGTTAHFDVRDWTCFFYNDSRVVERFLDDRFAFELGVGKVIGQ